MCQGVIVSLVKFKVGKKEKRVTLCGIGSHSALIAENRKRLERLGWKEGGGESVISVESNFTMRWDQYTIESGTPTPSDTRLINRAYKRCAGSAAALILHVKRVGRIDDALVKLLSQPAWAEYKKVVQPAWLKLFRKKSNRVQRLQ